MQLISILTRRSRRSVAMKSSEGELQSARVRRDYTATEASENPIKFDPEKGFPIALLDLSSRSPGWNGIVRTRPIRGSLKQLLTSTHSGEICGK